MPATPRVERIPTLRDNYTYLIVDEATREAAVVDAPEAAPVIERIEKLGVRLTKVLSTHHHPDHSAANPELAERYRVPVYRPRVRFEAPARLHERRSPRATA